GFDGEDRDRDGKLVALGEIGGEALCDRRGEGGKRVLCLGKRYSQKDKNEAKTDKIKHGIRKSVQNQSRRRMHLSGPT
nr:hypothetical protein [Tanacetum cinerariifolium]